ncbi:hypothetical protein E8E14_008874 [Neopestalotiopsis sp. 37M]|nr:hypothetical protein E8E14_008874 [Neopestalotiopsis sp. 37M]
MRTSFFIAADITCLLGFSQATSIPTNAVIVSRDVQLISPDTDIIVRNWTEHESTSLTAVDRLYALIAQAVNVVAVIYSNAHIVSGVCAATAATGPGQPVIRHVLSRNLESARQGVNTSSHSI